MNQVLDVQLTKDELLRLECVRTTGAGEHTSHAANASAVYDFITEGCREQKLARLAELISMMEKARVI